jgi:hypothetical protein
MTGSGEDPLRRFRDLDDASGLHHHLLEPLIIRCFF